MEEEKKHIQIAELEKKAPKFKLSNQSVTSLTDKDSLRTEKDKK